MWKGPVEDGVTQSLISKFLECPYAFYIYAILGLKEDEKAPDNMVWGDTFHKGLEILLETKDIEVARKAMIQHLEERYPHAPPSFKYTTSKMLALYKIKTHMSPDWKAELIMDEIIPIEGRKVRFRGKLDGLCTDHPDYGTLLAEHKCKGYIDPTLINEELAWDLQCNVYMYLHDVEHVAYDLIKIPEAQKYGPGPSYGETPVEYTDKIFHGPVGAYNNTYPIFKYPNKWMHQKVYPIPREDQERYWDQTIIPIVKRMMYWYDHVTAPGFDIENPNCFGADFYRMPIRLFSGRKTEKFKCNYHAVLTEQAQLDELIPVESYYSELEEA